MNTISNSTVNTYLAANASSQTNTISSKSNVQNNSVVNNSELLNSDSFQLSEKSNADIGIYSPYSFATNAVNSSRSASSGTDLYNKLNGKTVSVSYGGTQDSQVTISLSKREMMALYSMCQKADVEPSMVLAIMAHESQFDEDATSSAGAAGLMQVMPEYYEANLTRYSDIYSVAKNYAGIGDDIKDDPYNVYGNMAAGISMLKYWKNYYSESDMIKAYAQGYKGSGWSSYSIACDNQIRDVKSQIDAML